MKELIQALKGFWSDEEGATAVEYGVLVALIIAVLVVIIAALGGNLQEAFSSVNTAIENAS